MTGELLPCPFCGGKAEISESHEPWLSWSAWCHNCDISTGSYSDKTAPADIWNSRADIHAATVARAEKAEAALAEARDCAMKEAAEIAYGVDAKRFREEYDAEHKRKTYPAWMVDRAVDNALNIQAEDARDAILARLKGDA